MDSQDLRTRADVLRWYHAIDLGAGVVTRGVDNSPERLARIHLPADLSGRSVLDVGAWDGYFSFEAERRHAASGGGYRLLRLARYRLGDREGKAGFELARAALESRVEDVDIDVMDLSPERVERSMSSCSSASCTTSRIPSLLWNAWRR